MCWQAAESLECDTRAPERARRFVVRALSRAAPATGAVPIEWRALTEDAQLVVSELTTNALQANCTHLLVMLDLHRTELLVTVSDDASGWPQVRMATPTDSSGRGLHMVDTMAERWGSASFDDGKRVWAALRVPEPCATIVTCDL